MFSGRLLLDGPATLLTATTGAVVHEVGIHVGGMFELFILTADFRARWAFKSCPPGAGVNGGGICDSKTIGTVFG